MVIKIEPAEKSEEIELFTIDDVTYSIPNKVKVNLQLKYLFALKTQGEAAANYVMLSNLVGEEGYAALMNYDDLSQEQYDQVIEAALAVVTGGNDAGKAPKKAGRR